MPRGNQLFSDSAALDLLLLRAFVQRDAGIDPQKSDRENVLPQFSNAEVLEESISLQTPYLSDGCVEACEERKVGAECLGEIWLVRLLTK